MTCSRRSHWGTAHSELAESSFLGQGGKDGDGLLLASKIIFFSYHIGQWTLIGNHAVSNASSVKINASQELKHLVNGEKNEREKNPRLSNLFWVSHEDFKVCVCKYIYNPHNLPLWLITQCWWDAAAMSCFQDKYKSLGSGRGSTFWFQ